MTWPSFTLITDATDPVSRRVSWILERRSERQLVLLEHEGEFAGLPGEVERLVLDFADPTAITRAFQHADVFLLTTRGAGRLETLLPYTLAGRGVCLFDHVDPSAEELVHGAGRIGVARYGPDSDLDAAAETIAELLITDGTYAYETDLP